MNFDENNNNKRHNPRLVKWHMYGIEQRIQDQWIRGGSQKLAIQGHSQLRFNSESQFGCSAVRKLNDSIANCQAHLLVRSCISTQQLLPAVFNSSLASIAWKLQRGLLDPLHNSNEAMINKIPLQSASTSFIITRFITCCMWTWITGGTDEEDEQLSKNVRNRYR